MDNGKRWKTNKYVHFPPKKITTLTVQNIAQQNMIAYNEALFRRQTKYVQASTTTEKS